MQNGKRKLQRAKAAYLTGRKKGHSNECPFCLTLWLLIVSVSASGGARDVLYGAVLLSVWMFSATS